MRYLTLTTYGMKSLFEVSGFVLKPLYFKLLCSFQGTIPRPVFHRFIHGKHELRRASKLSSVSAISPRAQVRRPAPSPPALPLGPLQMRAQGSHSRFGFRAWSRLLQLSLGRLARTAQHHAACKTSEGTTRSNRELLASSCVAIQYLAPLARTASSPFSVPKFSCFVIEIRT
jgi:hypothetical protein